MVLVLSAAAFLGILMCLIYRCAQLVHIHALLASHPLLIASPVLPLAPSSILHHLAPATADITILVHLPVHPAFIPARLATMALPV